ncbi:MAG: hypothetical protein GY855_10780 [candidate division Zixibacteria bacterium]|nr:hypothetical protein [candidate division Zixibacteria bacterium]
MFDAIFGQDKVFGHLTGLLDEKKACGSYLFTGPKGVGKWAYGMLFTAAYCCGNDSTRPCGKCRSCEAILRLKHPDVQFLFPFPNLEASKKKLTVFQFSDPASGAKFSQAALDEIQRYYEEKIEDPFRIVRFEAMPNIPVEVVRDLRKYLSLRPLWGGKRAVVASDIENMSPRCADLFLKTIEEPPPETVIVLTTSYPEKIPATVVSRCKVFNFQAPDEEDLRDYLNRNCRDYKYDYRFIGRASDFSPGMARVLIEEGAIELRDKILGLLKSALGNRDYIDSALSKVSAIEAEITGEGVNVVMLITWILRDIIIMKNGGDVDDTINCDRAEILSSIAGSINYGIAEKILEDVSDIKIACELSNVMPTTAFTHLIALLKRSLAA